MKKRKIGFALLLVLVMTFFLVACGGNTPNDETTQTVEGGNASVSEDIVNIGVTDVIGSLNPLLQDGTEVVKYAASLSFLPLVELNKDLEFESQIATSITTEDNKHFVINIDENATWSDGEPITSEDVLFSFLNWASPEVGVTGMSIHKIEGTGDDGYVEPGATDVSGVRAIDEKTVEITTKSEMALYSFENIFGRYILILPEHILGDIPKGELLTHEWFNAPSVVSGPYVIKDFDLNHYVTYEANENYFKGAAKIKNLNIKVVTPSQLLTGLQSGEIDLVQQTMGAVLQEDYETLKGLENVTVYEGTPITHQSVFINVENIRDVRVRQAILYGIDRETILNDILQGQGEVVDGFLASAGPYYDVSLTPVAYDSIKAKTLLKEAIADGFDASKEYVFYVNSGDSTFVQIASFISAQLGEIGLKVKINTVDISTLLATAGSGEFDLLAVQYTYPPIDPYTDIDWLLSEGGWTRYYRDEIKEALERTQKTSDINEIKKEYLLIDTFVQEEVPMISAYVISALGATSNRLENAVPDVYGTLLNVEEWEIIR